MTYLLSQLIYLLRKRIADYESENKVNLFDKCFRQITGEQIIEFNVSGKSVRTDSKLIGSNIAFYSRYELIHSCLMLFYKSVFHTQTELLSNGDREILNDFVKEKSSSTVYKSDKDQINTSLIVLGKLIYTILNAVKESNNPEFQTLKRVFKEQYKVLDNSKIELTPNKEISAKSVQSPHDTDCDFRSKTGKKTKGFSHNITETCDSDNAVNLITDIQVEVATTADNDFIKPAVKNSQEILTDNIENIHADGAYNSEENQEFTTDNNINFYLTGFQGKVGRYDLQFHENALQVTDTQTDTQMPVTITKNNRYRIKTETAYRYFTEKEIESCRLRKQAKELPTEIGNKRNNVEASIFQLAYRLRKDKTRYRGKFKNKIWAIIRSLWVNFVRIANNLKKVMSNTQAKVNNTLHLFFFVNFMQIILILTQLELHRKNKFTII